MVGIAGWPTRKWRVGDDTRKRRRKCCLPRRSPHVLSSRNDSFSVQDKGQMTTTFPDLLGIYRRRRNLSQLQLSKRVGLNHSYISRLESHDRSPSRQVVMDISHELELSPGERDELLISAGFAPVNPVNLLSEPELLALYHLVKTSPQPTQEAIREAIRNMLTRERTTTARKRSMNDEPEK
jgi:transcriptional regulator with XRE-family HTH domain